jgi:hypothetical protein
MQLTPHFSLEEMTQSDTAKRHKIDNVPKDSETLRNLGRTAQILEQVRKACHNAPVIVTSGYRSPALNTIIGSRPTSQHIKGQAADFRVVGVPKADAMKAIIDAKIPFDQLILEFDSWIHISVPSALGVPRQQALIIDGQGTRPFLYKS